MCYLFVIVLPLIDMCYLFVIVLPYSTCVIYLLLYYLIRHVLFICYCITLFDMCYLFVIVLPYSTCAILCYCIT